jgi:hypothetical protein
MVLIGKAPSPQILYEVSDPLRPRLLCRITGTTAHLFTGDTITYLRSAGSGTEVVLRSLGSGNESVVTSIPKDHLEGTYYGPTAWTPDGGIAAATLTPDRTHTDNSDVWLFAQRFAGVIWSYPYPVRGCICRFGLPGATLAISPDGQYLVAGGPGKGLEAFVVFRLSDRMQVKAFDAGTGFVMWDRTGHRLFIAGTTTQSWTPEVGTVPLTGAGRWDHLAGLSPDGTKIAYTGYLGPDVDANLRVYVYDTNAGSVRMLSDQSRSQVLFVKSGWVWYLDEAPCATGSPRPGCGPWGTAPTNRVFAMNLTGGVEQEVAFSQGENLALDYGMFTLAEFWPNF